MSSLVITSAVGVLIIIMGIIFLTGRGSYLIAGLNHKSKEKRSKYDAEALSKFMGKITIPIGILIPFMGIESIADWYIRVFFIVICCLLIFTIIYANTGNRFRK